MSSPKTSNSISDTEGTPCDIKSNLLVARLLGQHLKEELSCEMKEQEDKKMSLELSFSRPPETDKKMNLEFNMWHSVGPINANTKLVDSTEESVHRTHSEQYLAARVKMVYDLISTLNINDKEEISKTFLAMSSSPESCILLRQSGCLPLLLQLIHSDASSKLVRKQALKALHCIVEHNADDKQGRRETRVFKWIEQILEYCENEDGIEENSASGENINPTPAVASLMKVSFDEEYRYAMCQFGALHALAKLVQTDHETHIDVDSLSQESITLRRYAGMALTNLTFGDITNKALLCSLRPFMVALVAQLRSPNEDLCQVTAGVLRNLSWRADSYIKDVLREVDAVTSLMKTALRVSKESTLKAVLSALWNLSAHNHFNKLDICRVDDAIEYLVKMLNWQAPSGTLTIVENVGGILRNISSIIALQEDYRAILRKHNCLFVLLHQLKSPSLTVVANACGTLWNLTARCGEDQKTLCQMGAVPALRSLIHSKHKQISMASTAALKNLLDSRAGANILNDTNNGGVTLAMRKRRALEQEIEAKLKESPENLGQSETSSMSYDSMSSPYTERGCSKSGTVKNGESDETSMTRSGNSVRFNLSFDESESKSVKSKSPVNAHKSILVKNDCSKYAIDEPKTNGYRKIEEPYDTFGDYAETDLDQPTDYSLKFPEHSSDLRKSEILISGSVSNDQYKEDKKLTVENALETPLMFSRSSSLGSVSSCGGEHVDDRSSVVSEFSRVVSGIVSPSELPDSPTQTVPPSPSTKKKQFFTSDKHQKPEESIQPSVFEDSVMVYKDENTPMGFSVATSFSSLTFDDDTPLVNELPPVNEEAEAKTKSVFSKSTNSNSTLTLSNEHGPETFDVELSVEEQQAMLKACIDSGKSTALKSRLPIKNFSLNPTKDKRDTCPMISSLPDTTINFCLEDDTSRAADSTINFCTEDDRATNRPIIPSVPDTTIHFCTEGDTARSIIPAGIDSTISFCTEDTPISISHAASNSDLSLLCPSEDSFLQNSMLPLSSCNEDDVELSTEDQEKLLNFCIAKGLQSLSNDSNDTFNDRKSSQSSTLSEITEDLLTDDHTLLKDCTPESANLVAISCTESDFSFANEIVNKELSEEEEKNLLNQCIALGMRSMKESTDLENIGPPSFLDEANLDSSMTNIEEIMDYPPGKNQKSKVTPKQKRNEVKNRYNTYTVKLSPSKLPPKSINLENGKKNNAIKDRRTIEKERFKTRTLSKGEFEELTKGAESKSPKSPQFSKGPEWKPPKSPQFSKGPEWRPPRSPQSPQSPQYDDMNTSSDAEGYAEQGKAKIVKPVTKVKSGIPVVKSKLPTSKSASSIKSTTTPELPGGLQRQNTFTKDEPTGIPVRKNSFRNSSKPNVSENVTQFKSGIPSRIKEPSPKVSRTNGFNDKSPEISKNRWSLSENNLNSNIKATSSTSLNASYGASKVSPCASQSALPVRKEHGGRNSYGFKK